MNLTYDSVLGIPTVETSGLNTNNTNNTKNTGVNLGVPYIILFAVILILFIMLFSSLGNSEVSNTYQSGSTKLLNVLLVSVVLVVILLNGLQYFFNINLTARLNNLFTDTPTLDLTVEEINQEDIPPVPEIKLKKQVFNIPDNTYTFDNAKALCQAYGARLATYDEVESAYRNGAEWCNYGWSDRQLALFPTQKDTWNHLQKVKGHENDCGRAGINGGYIANKNVRFGANCYGYKPKITDEEQQTMQTSSIYPRSMEDIKQEKRVEYWRNKIPEILVSPFNKKVWSLI